MKNVAKSFGFFSLAVLLTLVFGGGAVYAETGEAPSFSTVDLPVSETVQPDPGCDSPAQLLPPDWETPKITPATCDPVSFVCFNDDFFCGGCPIGTLCASEEISTSAGLCCTLNFQYKPCGPTVPRVVRAGARVS